MNLLIIKIFAIIFLSLDYIGYFFYPHSYFFRILGRLGFPLLCFCIVEEYKIKKSKEIFLLYILIFSIIVQIPSFFFKYPINFFFSIFLGLTSIYIFEKTSIIIRILPIFIFLFISIFFKIDYSFYGLMLTFFFFYFKNLVLLLIYFFSLNSFFTVYGYFDWLYFNDNFNDLYIYQFYSIFSMFFIFLYKYSHFFIKKKST